MINDDKAITSHKISVQPILSHHWQRIAWALALQPLGQTLAGFNLQWQIFCSGGMETSPEQLITGVQVCGYLRQVDLCLAPPGMLLGNA
jgi:hypothetical protein